MLHKLPATGKKYIYPQSMWYWGKHGNATLLPVHIKQYTKLLYILLKLKSPLWVLFFTIFFSQNLWRAPNLRSFILSLARLFNIAAYVLVCCYIDVLVSRDPLLIYKTEKVLSLPSPHCCLCFPLPFFQLTEPIPIGLEPFLLCFIDSLSLRTSN